MKLKKGYKNTDIGVIPEDWEVVEFSDVFVFLSTASYSRAETLNIGKIQYVHYGDIHTKLNYYLDFNSIELPNIKEEQLKTYSLIKDGDLIMADASEDYDGIGKGIEVINIRDKKAISGLHTFLLRGKPGYFYKGFKAYLHSNKLIKNQYDKLATGLKVYGLSKGNLKQIKIPLPSLPEQKAIATVLSDMDSLIEALEKKITKKRLIKKGAMQKLLKPKEGWEKKKLGDFLQYEQPTNYIVESTEYNDNYNTPVLTAGKTFVLGFTNEEKGVFENYPVIIFDDFTTASKYVNFSFKVKSSAMKILKPKNEDVNLRFIYDLMQLIRFPLGDHKRHWIGEFQDLKITIPPTKEEQTEIATILSDMDSEIERLEKQLAKHKQIKKGMMQELLTGKTRLEY